MKVRLGGFGLNLGLILALLPPSLVEGLVQLRLGPQDVVAAAIRGLFIIGDLWFILYNDIQ